MLNVEDALMGDSAALQSVADGDNQRLGGLVAQLQAHAYLGALGGVDEVQQKRMIERRMRRMVEADVGLVHREPALLPLGAAKDVRVLVDVGAHAESISLSALQIFLVERENLTPRVCGLDRSVAGS